MDMLAYLGAGQRFSRLCEIEPNQVQNSHLRGKRFCRGDTRFLSRVRVNDSVRLTGYRGSNHIGYRNRGTSLALGFAQCSRRVRRLARLGDEDGQFARPGERVAVFELAGIIHVHRHAAQFLDHELACHPSMTAGPRCHNIDSAQRPNLLVGQVNIFQPHQSLVRIYPRANRVHQAAWLLENFLDHVMAELALSTHEQNLRRDAGKASRFFLASRWHSPPVAGGFSGTADSSGYAGLSDTDPSYKSKACRCWKR